MYNEEKSKKNCVIKKKIVTLPKVFVTIFILHYIYY